MKNLNLILFCLCAVLLGFMTSCRGKRERGVKGEGGDIVDTSEVEGLRHDEQVKSMCRKTLEDLNNVGLPTLVSFGEDTMICRVGYVLSYNKRTMNANWVMWHLTTEHTKGKFTRKGVSYMVDEDVPEPRQELEDWNGTDGFDHGHLCPAGDNKWDPDAMRHTYYLSNMCAQNSRLNQGPWEHLESTCRRWADKFGDIYIVTGPLYYSKAPRKIGTNKRLVVPDAFYKVVLNMTDSVKALGFVYENKEPIKNDRLTDHVVCVDEVERLSGFDFFTALPDSVENEIEIICDLNKWSVYLK